MDEKRANLSDHLPLARDSDARGNRSMTRSGPAVRIMFACLASTTTPTP